MIKRLIERQIQAQEALLGVPLDYLRYMARASRSALFKFTLFAPLARHRRALPADAYSIAHLVAARHQDCGTCVQISLNMARQAGVEAAVLRAAYDEAPEALPGTLADVYHFACATVERRDDEADRFRPLMLEHYGEAGLVDLALALATAQVFPITKRALGYAKSCALITV